MNKNQTPKEGQGEGQDQGKAEGAQEGAASEQPQGEVAGGGEEGEGEASDKKEGE